MPDPPRTAYPWDPHGDPCDAVATAGAYILVDGRFAFMVGPTSTGESLAVVRLGGHREDGETPWQCAEREVLEEAGLRVSPRKPPCTYWLLPSDEPHAGPDGPHTSDALIDGGWPEEPSVPAPILIARGRAGLSDRLSAMYLAHAEGTPEPLHEARGLLFLRPAEVFAVLHRPITLDQYLRSGGRAILRPGIPDDLPLLPHLQLRVLPLLLGRYPALTS